MICEKCGKKFDSLWTSLDLKDNNGNHLYFCGNCYSIILQGGLNENNSGNRTIRSKNGHENKPQRGKSNSIQSDN